MRFPNHVYTHSRTPDDRSMYGGISWSIFISLSNPHTTNDPIREYTAAPIAYIYDIAILSCTLYFINVI